MAKTKKTPKEKAQPFRKVTVAMWSDAKFRALTPLLPSGQALWIYLLTGRETIQIPGLTACGRGSLTDSLRWSPAAFATAWGEIAMQGMAEADWEAPLIWIPNAIKHNFPESPSVVISWRAKWNEVPDCPLKLKAWQQLQAAMQAKGEAWAQAFAQACRQPVGQPAREPVAQPVAHQEQEQEQDSLEDCASLTLVAPPVVEKPAPKAKPTDPLRRTLSDSLVAAFTEERGGAYGFDGVKDAEGVKRLLVFSRDVADHVRRWRLALNAPAGNYSYRVDTIAAFATGRIWNHFPPAEGIAPAKKVYPSIPEYR